MAESAFELVRVFLGIMNLVGPQFGLAGSLSDELEGHFHLTID